MAAQALSHSREKPTARWPPRRMREAPAGATETGWSGVIGAGDRGAGAPREGAAEHVFVWDDTLAADPPVDRNDRRVPSAAAQGVEEVAEPGFDANFDMGEVQGNALDEANSEVALLADGVRDVEEELPAGHRVDGHHGWGLGISRRVSHAAESTGTGGSVASPTVDTAQSTDRHCRRASISRSMADLPAMGSLMWLVSGLIMSNAGDFGRYA